MAPATFERRMMSQMDFTAALSDCGVLWRFPFGGADALPVLFPLVFFLGMVRRCFVTIQDSGDVCR
jgi:hypothetical protein